MMSPGPKSEPRRTGSLRPVELAHAAVMAALCAAIAIIAVVVPFAAGLSLLGTVPMGLLAYRYRLRVLITATVAGGIIAFLIAGMGGLMTVVNCAYIGGLTGIVKRRGRGTTTVVAAALVAGALFGLAIVAALAVLARLRHLIFESVTANVAGVAAILERIPNMQGAAERLTRDFGTVLDYWPVLFFLAGVFSITWVSLVGWWALSKVLARLLGVPDVHKLEPSADTGPVVPVPLQLRDVVFRYPGTDRDALGPLSLDVQPGEHLAVTGPNGSGKTTLMLVLSGREPTSGTVQRPGAVGLGKLGGTAVVLQHPESQVLGTRVADDVVWGLPPGSPSRWTGYWPRSDSTGSASGTPAGCPGRAATPRGGRGAGARTVAVDRRRGDQHGRPGRPRRGDVGAVRAHPQPPHRAGAHHALQQRGRGRRPHRQPHRPGDRRQHRRRADGGEGRRAPRHGGRRRPRGAPVLELNGVSHEYGLGTPWAQTALRDIDFAVHEGDGVLIHGLNGSGKSTLAWIMAGLLEPASGSCLLDGRPVSDQVGAVAISFQAARLQLMRSHVALEIASTAGFSMYDQAKVTEALRTVGLEPTLASRRIEQLSGGQMRRVVLAGLLARKPRALILDEPLAGLDGASQQGLLQLLVDLRRRERLTVVVISHDFAGLEELCPRILHLENGVLAATPTAAGGMS